MGALYNLVPPPSRNDVEYFQSGSTMGKRWRLFIQSQCFLNLVQWGIWKVVNCKYLWLQREIREEMGERIGPKSSLWTLPFFALCTEIFEAGLGELTRDGGGLIYIFPRQKSRWGVCVCVGGGGYTRAGLSYQWALITIQWILVKILCDSELFSLVFWFKMLRKLPKYYHYLSDSQQEDINIHSREFPLCLAPYLSAEPPATLSLAAGGLALVEGSPVSQNHFFLVRRPCPLTETGGSGEEKGLALAKQTDRRLSYLPRNLSSLMKKNSYAFWMSLIYIVS